jgi:hypothetical protein
MFRVVFVGAIELEYDLPEYLKLNGLDELVRIVPEVSYGESLQYLWDSEALLLLQPGTMTQIPSKLVDYVAFGKPILAVCPIGSATSAVVSGESIGVVAEATQVNDIASAVLSLYSKWRPNDRDQITILNTNCYRQLNIKNIVERLSTHLEAACR